MADLTADHLTRMKAAIAESSKDFMGIADVTGKLVYLNDSAYALMGYAPGERPQFDSIADIHANDFDKFALEVIQPSVFATGSWTGIGYLRHKNGHPLAVKQTVFPLFGEDGTAYGTAAVMQDVTEIESKNEQIHKTMELFQKVLDSAKIGVVLINMETKTIEMTNKWVADMYKMSKEEIVGSKCHDVLCHRDPALCPHENERDVQTIVAERFIESKDGTNIPIIKTGTWITIDEKDYLVDTFVDISIQKELENSLKDAKITAEAASRSKTEFLSRMSHEMRTPLNAVIGMAQLAKKSDDIQKIQNNISTIEVSSKHLLGLINDILDLSKIEEGKLELNVEPFSMEAMVKKIVSVIAPKAEEKAIDFAVNIQPDIPDALIGDSMRLSQVLLNFLSNAVKFTPDNGNVYMDITLVKKDSDSATVGFAVSDSGIGMTDEQLGRLFNPFEQADNSISKKYGGTGLGLVISKRMINMMGSDINVTTEQGEGSEFSFVLDLPVAQPDDIQSEEAFADNVANIFKGKRALLVDDVDINRLIVVEMLSETGILIDEAANGLEAVEKCASNTYDIVLMDIQMPVMNGYEAVTKIRETDKHTPVIAMSAHVFKEDIERSLSMGMNGHISKPIEFSTMIMTMQRLMFANGETHGSLKSEDKVRLNAGYMDIPIESGVINLAAALENFNNDEDALAQEIKRYINEDLGGKLNAQLNDDDYAAAEQTVAKMRDAANSLSLTGMISYTANVIACFSKKDYGYAMMYMADLDKCNAKTINALRQLIQLEMSKTTLLSF